MRLLPAGKLRSCLDKGGGGAEAGEALCSDPEIGMIAFTGSTGVGRRVGDTLDPTMREARRAGQGLRSRADKADCIF